MHIDDYRFGRIVIDNKTYTSDLIIYPDRLDASWWREEGHLLQKPDLRDVVAAKPDILVIGTGAMGVMQVPESTVAFLKSKGITVIIERTGKAVEIFNTLPAGKKIVAAFHLTC